MAKRERNYRAEYEARQVRAQAKGYASYAQQRKMAEESKAIRLGFDNFAELQAAKKWAKGSRVWGQIPEVDASNDPEDYGSLLAEVYGAIQSDDSGDVADFISRLEFLMNLDDDERWNAAYLLWREFYKNGN